MFEKNSKHISLTLLGALLCLLGRAQCDAVIGIDASSTLEICDAQTVKFLDNSSGTVAQRTWNFGDGTATSSTNNPSHLFELSNPNVDATYTVTLEIRCIGGETDQTTETVAVKARPEVNFIADTGRICAFSDSVCFTNLSTTGAGYTYNWNFGDLSAENDEQVCHAYDNTGTYDVTLEVTNDQGCFNELTREDYIEVIESPNPDFGIVGNIFDGCVPFTITVENTTNDPQSSINQWAWKWGDMTPSSTEAEPGPHTYMSADIYEIELTATNSFNCSNSTTQIIEAKVTPTADLNTESPVCLGEEATITYVGDAPSNATYAWSVSAGSVSPSSGQGPVDATFNLSGIQTVFVTVTEDGCSATGQGNVVVYPEPIIELTSSAVGDSICNGDQVFLSVEPALYPTYHFKVNGANLSSGSSATTMSEDFEDGDLVTVEVVDWQGCTAETDPFEMHVTSVIDVDLVADDDSVCVGEAIEYTATPGLDIYTFYDRSAIVQSGPSNTLTYSFHDDLSYITALGSTGECVSEQIEGITPELLQPLTSVVVNCDQSTNSTVTFGWAAVEDAFKYEIQIEGGAFESVNGGLTHELMGLAPDSAVTAVLRVIGASQCVDSILSLATTCRSIPCDPITFDLIGDSAVCKGQTAELEAINLSTSNYTLNWDGQGDGTATDFEKVFNSTETISVEMVDLNQPACPGKVMEYEIQVTDTPNVSLEFSVNGPEICEGEYVEFAATPTGFDYYDFRVNGNTIQKNFSNVFGSFSLSDGDLVSVIAHDLGCASLVNASSSITQIVNEELSVPEVNCENTTSSSISIEWGDISGASGYAISIDEGPFENPSSGSNGTTHQMTSLGPGEMHTVVVTALGPDPCGESEYSLPAVCFTQPCQPIDFNLTEDLEVCEGESVTIVASDLSTGEYGLSWSGQPYETALSKTFTATTDTIVVVRLMDSTQAVCPAQTQFVEVLVTPQPAVTLSSSTITDTICSSESLVFTASPGGFDNYDFMRGFEVLQSGSNNVLNAADWENGDSLFVIASNGTCQGDSSNVIHTYVFDELTTPPLNCGVTTDNSIEFMWDGVLGAEGYEVSTNGTGFIDPSSGALGLTHAFTGLNPGDQRTLYVRAVGDGPCGSGAVSEPVTCTAIPCIPADFTPMAAVEGCEGEGVTLSIANVVTNSGNFDISWMSEAATQDLTYNTTFDSSFVAEISVSDPDEPVACPATTKFIEVTTNPIPAVTLTSNATNDSICSSEALVFEASPQGYDSYQFVLGTQLMQADGNHLYQPLFWEDDDSLTVMVSDKGCAGDSAYFTNDIFQATALEAPQVNCGLLTNSSITFQWDALDGALGYEVNVDGVGFASPSSGQLGLTHTLSGLSPGDEASIIVKAIGESPCTDSEMSLQVFCEVMDCPALNFALNAPERVCEGEDWGITVENITVPDYSVAFNGNAFGDALTYAYSPQQDTSISVDLRNNQKPDCPVTTKSVSVTITEPPVATLTWDDADNEICLGDALEYTAGPLGQFDYSFYDGFALLQSGTNHQLSLTDMNDGDQIDVVVSLLGCSDTAYGQPIAIEDPLPSPQPNCSTATSSQIDFFWDAIPGATGYEIDIDGGGYQAINGTLGHQVTGLSAGQTVTAYVKALGNLPCGETVGIYEASCIALDCDAVDFTMTPQVEICEGEQVNMVIAGITSTSGNNDFTIEWNEDAGNDQTNFDYTPQQDTTIAVSVVDNTNNASCPATTKYFELEVTPLPTVTLDMTSLASCEGDTQIFAASPARYDNFEFFYNGVTSIQDSPDPVLITDTLSNGAEISVLVTDQGCSAQSQVSAGILSVNPRPSVSFATTSGSNVSCFGDTVFAEADAGFTQYDFYVGDLLVQSGADHTMSTTLVTDGDTLLVVVTDANSCSNETLSVGSFIEMSVNALPTVSIATSSSGNICEAASIAFTASPSGLSNYDFYVGSTPVQSSSSNTASINSIEDGEWVAMRATDADGCQSESAISTTFTVLPLPDLVLSTDTVYVCQGDTANLSASDTTNGALTNISWNGGAGSGEQYSVVTTTNSTVTVAATLNGCTLNESIYVGVDTDFPVINTGTIQTVCLGDSIQLSATGALSYAWVDADEISDTTSASPMATPADTAARVYQVIGTNYACSSTAEAFVLIDRCLSELPEIVPDGISPNGDGKNDSWNIKDVDYFANSTMVIYNRWGNVVYESTPFLGWDGNTTDGKLLPDGTYYYVLDIGNETPHYTGFIMIHR